MTEFGNLGCMAFFCNVSPNTIPCSRHGTCDLQLKQCVCASDWSSLGDFALVLGVDCDQYLPAIRALAFISIILQPIGIAYSCRIMYIRHKKGTKWGDPLFRLPFLAFSAFISNFILGVTKAIDPVYFRAGKSTVETFFTVSMSYVFMCMCILFPSVIANFFNGYARSMPQEAQKRVEDIRRMIQKTSYFLYGINFFGCCLPLFTLGYPEFVAQFVGVFYVTLGLSFLFLRQVFLMLLTMMITELKSSIAPEVAECTHLQSNHAQLKAVLAKLQLIESTIRRQSIMVIISNLAFGCWPYLQRKTAYLSMVKGIMSFIQSMAILFLMAPSNTLEPLKTALKSAGVRTAKSRVYISSARIHISGPSTRMSDCSTRAPFQGHLPAIGSESSQSQSISVQSSYRIADGDPVDVVELGASLPLDAPQHEKSTKVHNSRRQNYMFVDPQVSVVEEHDEMVDEVSESPLPLTSKVEYFVDAENEAPTAIQRRSGNEEKGDDEVQLGKRNKDGKLESKVRSAGTESIGWVAPLHNLECSDDDVKGFDT